MKAKVTFKKLIQRYFKGFSLFWLSVFPPWATKKEKKLYHNFQAMREEEGKVFCFMITVKECYSTAVNHSSIPPCALNCAPDMRAKEKLLPPERTIIFSSLNDQRKFIHWVSFGKLFLTFLIRLNLKNLRKHFFLKKNLRKWIFRECDDLIVQRKSSE